MIRLNVFTELGKEAAARFGIMGLPTLLVLDGSGEVIHRKAGIPSRKDVVAKAMAG